MPTATTIGTLKVEVDVRDVMNSYLCSKVGPNENQYPNARYALEDLGSILASLGKERGFKLKVVVDFK